MIYHLEIYTQIERNQTLTMIKDALQGLEGWIIRHQLFSNISASLLVELPAIQIDAFVQSLALQGFKASFKEKEKAMPQTGDMTLLIAINFIHDEPDLKRDVPSFG